MAKGTDQIDRWWLFLAAAALLSAAFLMKLLPVFAFVALAPLFRLSDGDGKNTNSWENTELILFALAIGFFSAVFFDVSQVFRLSLLAITFTLPFLAFALVRGTLGPLTGHFLVILFWLAIEYALVKVGLGRKVIFLADLLRLKDSWVAWNGHTGYLGASLWLLMVNWMTYKTFLQGRINWIFLLPAIALLVIPWWYGGAHPVEAIPRDQMITLYDGGKELPAVYVERGEWVVRTAAWVSVLVILFSLVRSRTKKKN